MNISSVNSFNVNNRQVSFNGLWGKTIRSVDYDQTIGTTKVTQDAYYFPFIDETQMDIDSAVEENTSSQIIKGTDGKRQLLVRNCMVCAPLPISNKQYEAYHMIKPSVPLSDKEKFVHVVLRDKYKNSGFDNDAQIQHSAVSSVVLETLNKEFNVTA
ncbi:MAG: hypothetical protein IJY61_07030 [Candidatus Gastranaerophilales bacterium]|nr:hypothetical protein [Candidatus Gastranaerophilales bacterium]